ncbi:MAG TPA: diaminopimelate epimerase [Chthonomonadales bacterium]|nr:diaminopimelate epimerase [Chthonomonadales bacterium]
MSVRHPTPERLPFAKMQGVGNDFVVVDARRLPESDWPSRSRDLCDRHLGVGADGLIAVDTSSIADVAMRMYNPDGTPDFCGNGLRCVTRFVLDPPGARRESLTVDATLSIQTLRGVREVRLQHDGGGSVTVTVDMDRPRFDPLDIPMGLPRGPVVDHPVDAAGEELVITALSTGSTHAVALVDTLPEDERFVRVSRAVEEHRLFPERTSLMWAVVEAWDRLRLRIWERGAGETWGCGTGACAAVVAATLRGLVGERVRVVSAGGELEVWWPDRDRLWLTGPAEYVFVGSYPLEPRRGAG